MQGADTEEEVKVIAETRRVLDAPDLRMSVDHGSRPGRRRPQRRGRGSSSTLLPIPTRSAQLYRASPGVVVLDDPATQRYPTPRGVAGSDDVQVGRIRRDTGRDNGIALFFSADNLRKGAATNAVQVAELLLDEHRRGHAAVSTWTA